MGVKLPAFQRLVDAHWRDVARLAHALAGPADGDDVAQQAWVRALAAYPDLTTGKNLRSWLLTITAHCASDAHRARGRRPTPLPAVHVTDIVDAGDATEGPEHALPVDLGDPLWVAVRELPERQRTAIALRYVADLDHAQIAAALGTSTGATRRLVSDALRTLRAALVPQGDVPQTEEVR